MTAYDELNRVIAKHISILEEKATELQSQKHVEASRELMELRDRIRLRLKFYITQSNLLHSVSDELRAARRNPVILYDWGIKEILTNFLIALSGIGLIMLAATARQRGAFWYHPETTGTGNQLKDFNSDFINAASRVGGPG